MTCANPRLIKRDPARRPEQLTASHGQWVRGQAHGASQSQTCLAAPYDFTVTGPAKLKLDQTVLVMG
jgi:hypothetical protein